MHILYTYLALAGKCLSRDSGKLRERGWTRAAGGPIEQLDSMHDRRDAIRELDHAADVAGRDHVREDPRDVCELARAQLSGELGLEQVVGAGRAAADMALGDVLDREPRGLQQILGQGRDLLAVLHRARGMVRDD